MILLKPNSILQFGKNKGKTLVEIYKFQPSYIEWLVMETEEYIVDLEGLEALPSPTPFGYNPKHFSKYKPSFEFNEENIFDILESADTVNAVLTAEGIKQSIDAGFQVETLHGFKFPDHVKEWNKYKASQG